MKYKEYIKGDTILPSERLCNVCICSVCNKEYLLGSTPRHNCDGSGFQKYTLRKNLTLLNKIK